MLRTAIEFLEEHPEPGTRFYDRDGDSWVVTDENAPIIVNPKTGTHKHIIQFTKFPLYYRWFDWFTDRKWGSVWR